MSGTPPPQDPLEFMTSMWSKMGFSIPGMVAPTVDLDELDKRIADLRAVEGWLKMNLNMLQMSIQCLEMQRATVAAVKAMSQTGGGAPEAQANPFANPALWPWNFLQPGGTPAGPGAAGTAPAPAPGKPEKT